MANKESTQVVKDIDLRRYMGTWYEIASCPWRFQPKDGINTRATYTLRKDDIVHVLNETWNGDKRSFIEGTAYKANPNSNEAKFKVKYFVPPFLPLIPIMVDYWVLFLDEDYTYALIGQPTTKHLCILCRQKTLEDGIYNELVEMAKKEGYDVTKLKKTMQTNPETESESEPDDTKGIWWFKKLFGK